MTEILFWHSTICKMPISFAIDIAFAFVLGIQLEALPKGDFFGFGGFHELSIYLGPFMLTFTIYRVKNQTL